MVSEGEVNYAMPFVLKHILEKHLASIINSPTSTPIADWFTRLDEDRKLLISVSRNLTQQPRDRIEELC